MNNLQPLLTSFLCFGIIATAAAAANNTLATKCATEFTKVTPCLPFATNKAPTPTKDCCDSVTALKTADPACLCFIIQQVHDGSSPQVKSLSIQESRLLQLPAACQLANASISECPKLLHLAPNSSDAAIFSNTAAPTTPTTPPSGGGGDNGGSSAAATGNGIWQKPQLGGCMVFAVAAFYLGFLSAAF